MESDQGWASATAQRGLLSPVSEDQSWIVSAVVTLQILGKIITSDESPARNSTQLVHNAYGPNFTSYLLL